MVQRNEFYNFSETGLAYLSYADNADKFGAYASFNVGGNFSDFVEFYQDYGLVLESDFSNEEFADINYKTYKDYYYVSPAFVGSSQAREAMDVLIKNSFIN